MMQTMLTRASYQSIMGRKVGKKRGKMKRGQVYSLRSAAQESAKAASDESKTYDVRINFYALGDEPSERSSH